MTTTPAGPHELHGATPAPSLAPSRPQATGTPADGIVVLEVGDYYYKPQVVTVTVGTKVIWHSVGELVHTIDPVDPPSKWRGGVTAGAGSPDYRFTFNRLGIYKYTCNYHPSAMDAWIVVIEGP
ncbi:MAG: cupredoxin domain-containing protein [Anaerolineales bacterium]